MAKIETCQLRQSPECIGAHKQAYLWHVLVVPVILVVAIHRCKYPGTLRLGVVDVIVAGFEDEYREIWLLREAGCERQPGCTTTYDSDIPSVRHIQEYYVYH